MSQTCSQISATTGQAAPARNHGQGSALLHTTWWHWFFLFLAIVLEVTATTIMTLSHNWTFVGASVTGLGLMWFGIGLSYLSLAKATTGIPVGVAFAFWEGLGLVLVSLSGLFLLGEELSWQRCTGIACVLVGALLVHQGTEHGDDTATTEEGTGKPAEERAGRAS